MLMKSLNRIIQTSIAAVLLLLAAPSAVHADSATPAPTGTFVFESVDSVEVFYKDQFVVSGIPQGQTQVRELRFYFDSPEPAAYCHKQALLAMEHPGRYLLKLAPDSQLDGFACKLIRR
jgi:hypothetical protein